MRGDPDSPVSKGLACAKGYYSVEALYGKDRLTRAVGPERRRARRGRRCAQALDLVARKLRETIDKHGKDSVAIYGSRAVVGHRRLRRRPSSSRAASAPTTSRRARGCTRRARWPASQGTFGLDGTVGCYEDVDHADIFVLWDANLAESDPVLFSRMLERRRKDPAVRIIEVATRTSRTSYAADQSLLHAPHTAPAIANAICQEIVARKWMQRTSSPSTSPSSAAGRTSATA